MAFIGNSVQNQGFTPAIDYFSGNGSTVTFTLSRPVVSVAQMIVAVDNVIQNPASAYTVSGSSITFTSAPLSGTNNIWVEYTSLITTYAALSQSPSVVGDITASGGYLAVGSFGASFVDGTIVDYVTGMGRITAGPADGITLYNGGTSARSSLASWSSSGTLTNTAGGSFAGNVGIGTTNPYNLLSIQGNSAGSFVAAPGLSLYDTSGNANSRNWAFMNGAGAAGYGQLALISSSASGGTPTANTYWLLDNAGRMTVPSQVAFQVRVNNSNYITTSPVPFGTAVYNTGNAWNTSTYTFTAPVAGRYMFLLQWYSRVNSNNGGSTMKLIVNGTQVAYSDTTIASATTYLSVPFLSILNLSAGDSVYYNYSGSNGTYYGGVQETNLYGYLLG